MSTFVRRRGIAPSPTAETSSAITKPGPNTTLLVSTGIADLDRLIGGGIPLGKLVIVMEDAHAPHHLLLLRYFMAQAVTHNQPTLFLSSLASPKTFLSTLPAPSNTYINNNNREDGGLRIAWQYEKYEKQRERQPRQDYVSVFDVRKALTPALTTGVQCCSLQGATAESLLKQCKDFMTALTAPRLGRIVMHSLCAPLCMDSTNEWELLSCLLYLKALLQIANNAVVFITIPTSLLTGSLSKRWQHLADILLSVKALPDDDQSKQFMDFREMVGLVHVHKLSSLNTQVPAVPESASHAIKIVKKREVILEQLHLAPVAGAQLSSGCNSSSSPITVDY